MVKRILVRLLGFLAVTGGGVAVSLLFSQPAQAACTPGSPAPTNLGVVTQPITIDSAHAATYTVWSRIKAVDASKNSYWFQLDNCVPVKVGDASTIPAGQWTWIDYQNGSSSSKISVDLSAGSHTIKMSGSEDGVELDRVLLTNNCAPTPAGKGEPCDQAGPPPPPPPPPPPGSPQTLFRFFHKITGEHFYTISTVERDHLVNTAAATWTYEGPVFKAYTVTNNTCSGGSGMYRFFNTHSGYHHYTLSTAERDALLADAEWQFENIGFCEDQAASSTNRAIYRFFNNRDGRHLYTGSTTERDHLINTDPTWTFENIGFYAPN